MELISPRKRRKINVTMCCREYFEEKETRIQTAQKRCFSFAQCVKNN